MKATPSVLVAVATELAKLAKSSLPEMREGEEATRECYQDSIYYRKTMLNGKVFRNWYDFNQRKSRQVAVVES